MHKKYRDYFLVVRHIYTIENFSTSCIPKLRKRPGTDSEVDNAPWDCFRGRKQKAVTLHVDNWNDNS